MGQQSFLPLVTDGFNRKSIVLFLLLLHITIFIMYLRTRADPVGVLLGYLILVLLLYGI